MTLDLNIEILQYANNQNVELTTPFMLKLRLLHEEFLLDHAGDINSSLFKTWLLSQFSSIEHA